MKKLTFSTLLVIIFLMTNSIGLAAQLNFTPVLTVSEEYNDNIFLSDDNEEEDFITRTTFGGTLELLGRTAGLELTYLPAYEWYADNSDFDGWEHDLLGRTWYNFTANTSIELTNAFIRTKGLIESDEFAAATTEDPLVAPAIETDRLRDDLEEYYTNATTVRMDHQFGADDTVYAAFAYRILRGVDLVGRSDDADDYDIWEPSVGGTYWFTNFWGFETDLVYTHGDYEVDTDREDWYGRFRLNRRVTRHLDVYGQYEHYIIDFDEDPTAGADDVDYDVYLPTIGFNYQLDENTSIDIGAGWYFQDLDTGENDDGFVVNALADKVWPFRRGLIGVTLLSGTDIDDEGVEDLGFNVYYEGSVRGEYGFTPRFSGTATVGYRWDDYPDEDPGRTDETIFATAGLEYQALRWMFVSLDYEFRDLSSDVEDDEYTNNRVIFSITLTPEQPFRLFR